MYLHCFGLYENPNRVYFIESDIMDETRIIYCYKLKRNNLYSKYWEI